VPQGWIKTQERVFYLPLALFKRIFSKTVADRGIELEGADEVAAKVDWSRTEEGTPNVALRENVGSPASAVIMEACCCIGIG
jgi:hypothetical protein